VGRQELSILFGAWAIVVAYAVLHDQYIALMAPEHFAVYHPTLHSIRSPALLAAYWALVASFGPGYGLAVWLMIATRVGHWPRLPARAALKGTLLVVLITEVVSASAGLFAYLTRAPVYGSDQYPDLRPEHLATQTIQLTAYLAGAASGASLIACLAYRRWRLRA
jgi:hypothetical protein